VSRAVGPILGPVAPSDHPESRRGFSTFDDFCAMDIRVLQETGVIQDWTVVDFDTFSGSSQEFKAWSTYTKLGLNSPVGR
jgi:hypothetical protein